MKLFYIILGAEPAGRNIEQHDVFFGVAETINDLVPEMKKFWADAKDVHIDCYQEVKFADGYEVKIVERQPQNSDDQLFFINLGGYKPGQFEELHKQYLMVGKTMGEIIKRVKKTEFYKEMSFKGAESHIDDKYGVDIDDVFKVSDILPESMRERYSIVLEKSTQEVQDNFTFIGYLSFKKLKK